jgi:hypothetical protein
MDVYQPVDTASTGRSTAPHRAIVSTAAHDVHAFLDRRGGGRHARLVRRRWRMATGELPARASARGIPTS